MAAESATDPLETRFRMPNAGVHLLLVSTVLERWRASPADAPFDPTDAAAVRGFMHGSLAPDIGYFPGGVRLFSELAHLERPADLARAMLASAQTPEHRAYALGWATHLLADAAIHPLLNEAGGEYLYGDRTRPVSSTEDVITHMRLEFGLDAAMLARFSVADGVWCEGNVTAETIGCLVRAFQDTYGWSPAAASLLASHRFSGRLSRIALTISRVHGATFRRRPAHRATRALVAAASFPILRAVRDRAGAPVLNAVMRPLPSPRWLVDATADAVHGVASSFEERCGTDLAALPNVNLITGADPGGEPDPRTREAQHQLARLTDGRRVNGAWTAIRTSGPPSG